ncbi:uncharacterized protein LOC121431228 [Lytechinus variegatus]|uniref:uncharacterized protein LOC121431228 n=1 Tax=Lytechinus variegatus TaxID=7654 RepID=UPI001BB119F8|nr:uncharacterized protein LOC121431228 [Lytechinus variegatus]
MDLYYIVSTLMHSIVIIVGIPGNLLMITVYSRRKRTPYSIFVIGLAIIDAFLCITISPVRIYHYFTFGRRVGGAFCAFHGLTFFLETNSSSFLSALLSFNRYVSVCKPHQRISKRTSAVSAAGAFGFSLAMSAPAIWTVKPFDNPGRGSYCAVPLQLRHTMRAFFYFLFSINALAAVFTLVACAFVIKRIRRLGKVGGRMPVTRKDVTRKLPNMRPGSNTKRQCVELISISASVADPSPDIGLSLPSTSLASSANIPPGSIMKPSTVIRRNSEPSTTFKTSSSQDPLSARGRRQEKPRARIGHRVNNKATRIHLAVIGTYLVMWLANIYALIMSLKQGFSYRSIPWFIRLMGRACALNRICHFVIAFAFHKDFREECRQVITENWLTRFLSRNNSNQI